MKAFRRILKEHVVLLAELTEAGSTLHTTTLMPQQIAILVRFWGMPTLVAESIKKIISCYPKNDNKEQLYN